MKLDKKNVMWLGVGAVAIWYFFMRKKKPASTLSETATDVETSEFLGRRAKKRLKKMRRKLKRISPTHRIAKAIRKRVKKGDRRRLAVATGGMSELFRKRKRIGRKIRNVRKRVRAGGFIPRLP